jgi:hypothetical protein
LIFYIIFKLQSSETVNNQSKDEDSDSESNIGRVI